MSRITPFLWFDTEAEEAANFYVSIFKNSRIGNISRYPEGGPRRAGQVLTVDFELDGHPFVALNGGPEFRFTEAVSFSVPCATQDELDYYWERLTAEGGQEGPCGWVKDKYGLSWQVNPTILGRMLQDPDRQKASRVMAAMMKMKKIEIPKLQSAYENAEAVGG